MPLPYVCRSTVILAGLTAGSKNRRWFKAPQMGWASPSWSLGLPPHAAKNRDAPQCHSCVPACTGGAYHRVRPKRPCHNGRAVLWVIAEGGLDLLQCGSGPKVSPPKFFFWNFRCHPRKSFEILRCKFLLSGALSATKLTQVKLKNTTNFHSRRYYVHPARDNTNTRAQQLLRWVTVSEQSGPKSEGLHAMSPGPRPTSVSSGIVIRPTVRLQYANVTDRQDRERSDCIGRTVLQTVTNDTSP